MLLKPDNGNMLKCFINTCSLVNSSLDIDDVLDGIIKVSRDVLRAEAGAVLLLDEDGKTLMFKIALGAVGRKLEEKISLSMGEGIAGEAAETGRPIVVKDAGRYPGFSRRIDDITGFRTRSVIAVPLRAGNRIIGVLEMINPLDKKTFSQDDVPLFQAFACQVSVAIENARMHKKILEQKRLEQELVIAGRIQKHLLPEKDFRADNVEIKSAYIPAAEVGGDFFDIIKAGSGRLIVSVGDVSGKGIPAALYMMSAVTEFRSLAGGGLPIEGAVSVLNDTLASSPKMGMFTTMLCICIDKNEKKVSIVNAGHPDPIFVSGRRPVLYKGEKGIPLGILKGAGYTASTAYIDGDTDILLYTDGVTDACDKKRSRFGSARLLACAEASYAAGAGNLLMDLFADIDGFTRGMCQCDDLTGVFIKIRM